MRCGGWRLSSSVAQVLGLFSRRVALDSNLETNETIPKRRTNATVKVMPRETKA